MFYLERIHPDAVKPKRAHDFDSGLDLTSVEDMVIEPGETKLVPTGWKMAVMPGQEIQIRPRSGLALKHGIIILNSPGTIDSPYRGHVQAILHNLGKKPFEIKKGDRIAQMVLCNVILSNPKEVDKLPDSPRGEKGFGSTGV